MGSIQSALDHIPRRNLEVIGEIIRFCTHLSEKTEDMAATVENLSKHIGPVLAGTKDSKQDFHILLVLLIRNGDTLFGVRHNYAL